MTVANLLDRLSGVRRVGSAKWIARCPSHDDKHPSLSIAETDGGVVLARCWAGCSIDAICDAVGVDVADLFPKRSKPGRGGKPTRKPWSPTDLIELAAAEATIVWVDACDMVRERPLSPADHERLTEAARRLGAMLEAVR